LRETRCRHHRMVRALPLAFPLAASPYPPRASRRRQPSHLPTVGATLYRAASAIYIASSLCPPYSYICELCADSLRGTSGASLSPYSLATQPSLFLAPPLPR